MVLVIYQNRNANFRQPLAARNPKIYGGNVEPDRIYKLGITEYAFKNPELFLGIAPGDLGKEIEVKKLSDNDRSSFFEYLSLHNEFSLRNEGRLVLLD